MKYELWLPVVGYNGFFEVSNLGNVRSLGRIAKHGRYEGHTRTYFGRLLIPQVAKRGGYLTVLLSVGGRRKNCKIHRLVAEAFLLNPNDFPMVNHKDFNRQNNNVENLEWCDAKYNTNYSLHRKPSMLNKRGKPVDAYDRDGNFVSSFASIRDAGRVLNVFGQNICAILSGKSKWIKGYTFKYKT